jgi:hypothetical protein
VCEQEFLLLFEQREAIGIERRVQAFVQPGSGFPIAAGGTGSGGNLGGATRDLRQLIQLR